MADKKLAPPTKIADLQPEPAFEVNPLINKTFFDKSEKKEDIIFSRKYPAEIRAKFLDAITDAYERGEAISKLLSMYEFDENKAELELLLYIGKNLKTVEVQQRIHVGDILYQLEVNNEDRDPETEPNQHVSDDIYAKVVQEYVDSLTGPNPRLGLNSTSLMHCLPFLLKSETYLELGKTALMDYTLNGKVELKNRYLSLVFLEKRETVPVDVVFPCVEAIYDHADTTVEYTILSAQFMLMKRKEFPRRVEILSRLLTIGETETVDYNRRADALDVVLNTGSEEDRARAKKIITSLGKFVNVYENKQNVHFIDVSALLKVILNTPLSVENVDDVIEDIKSITPAENKKLVEDSLTRILMDTMTFATTDTSGKPTDPKTATDLLLHTWSFIMASPHKEEFLGRLLEELSDASDTCSSGHANRLVNTISGFDGLSASISWEQQVVANFEGRMIARIKAIPDEKVRDQILLDLVDKNLNTPVFNQFYIANAPAVMDELRGEFVTSKLIEADSFDSYIRTAMARFDQGRGDESDTEEETSTK